MSLAISAAGLFPPVVTNATPLSPANALSSGAIGSEDQAGGFNNVLTAALNQVSSVQGSATQQVSTLLQGGNTDMSKVMISVEKADVAFQLMMGVRNKIVSAYQDIEKMQF